MNRSATIPLHIRNTLHALSRTTSHHTIESDFEYSWMQEEWDVLARQTTANLQEMNYLANRWAKLEASVSEVANRSEQLRGWCENKKKRIELASYSHSVDRSYTHALY